MVTTKKATPYRSREKGIVYGQKSPGALSGRASLAQGAEERGLKAAEGLPTLRGRGCCPLLRGCPGRCGRGPSGDGGKPTLAPLLLPQTIAGHRALLRFERGCRVLLRKGLRLAPGAGDARWAGALRLGCPALCKALHVLHGVFPTLHGRSREGGECGRHHRLAGHLLSTYGYPGAHGTEGSLHSPECRACLLLLCLQHALSGSGPGQCRGGRHDGEGSPEDPLPERRFTAARGQRFLPAQTGRRYFKLRPAQWTYCFAC